MTKKKGKIIAIVGAPASGKSSLVKFLQTDLNAKVFLEGEDGDLPSFVKNNIEENKNGIQTILFFHNQTISQYLQALNLKECGHYVILDTFWLSNLFFLETMLEHSHERSLIKDLIKTTGKIFSPPDILIYLEAADETIRNRLLQRGRNFEANFLESALKISRAHQNFFAGKNIKIKSRVIKLNAEDFDPKGAAEILKKHLF